MNTPDTIARLGENHGYCFDGDFVEINADILCDSERLSGQSWALQLWAGDLLQLGELPLGLLFPDDTGYIAVSGTTAALPPAGSAEYSLNIRLICDGEVVDQADYPQAASFTQPSLSGAVSVEFAAGEASISIERIENPRAAENISGTLALEIWSLDAPCNGGAWSGTPIASQILGSLDGQQSWIDCQITTSAAELPKKGVPTLMLREWTPAGYVTRDFRTLPVAKAKKPAAAKKADPKPKVAVKKASKEATKTEVKPEAKKPAKAAKPDSAPALVAVNGASKAEISAVKGISDALAAAIIAARPYAKLDELLRAKGMGPKLLEKVKPAFKL